MSEIPQNQPKFVLPTLQSNFNYSINEVLKMMNSGDIQATWTAIKTLYNILPPEIFKSVTKRYEKIRKKLEVGMVEGIGYEALVQNHANGLAILDESAIPLFRDMYERLYAGGYLEKAGLQPRNTQKRRLTVDESEEES